MFLFTRGNIWISHMKFMINEHTIANVGLYYFVLPAYNNVSNKMCFYKLAFTNTSSKCENNYVAWSLKAICNVNILVLFNLWIFTNWCHHATYQPLHCHGLWHYYYMIFIFFLLEPFYQTVEAEINTNFINVFSTTLTRMFFLSHDTHLGL